MLDGLPCVSRSTRAIASATSGSTGVVAAWSRYTRFTCASLGVMSEIEISRRAARRLVIDAQLLGAERHAPDRRGILATSAFDGRAAVSWRSRGWTNDRNASQMLEFLSARGLVLVAGRAGQERLWDLTERCVPAEALLSAATPAKLIRDATVRSLCALGVATPTQIQNMLPAALRGSVAKAIPSLERAGELIPARVAELKGRWYVHAAD